MPGLQHADRGFLGEVWGVLMSIEEFARHHHAYNGISERRARQQTAVLRAFGEHAGVDPIEAGAPELRAYLATLVESGLKPSSVAFHLKAITPFFAWAQETGKIDALKLAEIRLVKAPRGASAWTPRPYSRDQIQTLWRQLDRDYPWSYFSRGDMRRGNDPGPSVKRGEHNFDRWFTGPAVRWDRVKPFPERVQMNALLAILLGGGPRMIETHRLTIIDADPVNAYMVVRGAAKNTDAESRDRAIPWSTAYMRDSVALWIAVRARLKPDHDHLWLSLAPGWITTPMRVDRFRKLLLNLGQGWEFHRMRHTAATEMLRAGYPLEKVQQILGHASISMTMRYLQLLPGDVVAAAQLRETEFSRAVAPRAA